MPTIRLITVFAIAVHSALGCCWHHQHAIASNDTQVARVECGHGHHHADSPGNHVGEQGDHQQPYEEPCDEGQCVYLREVSHESNVVLELSQPTLILSAFFTESPAACLQLRTSVSPWLDISNPSIRPHLLKQVLLI